MYNSAVGKALRQHVGVDVASRFCASRQVPTAQDLVRVAAAARFGDVKLQVQQMTARLPPPERFVLGHLAATPIASTVRALDGASREALGRDVAEQLSAYKEGDGLAFAEEVHVLSASA